MWKPAAACAACLVLGFSVGRMTADDTEPPPGAPAARERADASRVAEAEDAPPRATAPPRASPPAPDPRPDANADGATQRAAGVAPPSQQGVPQAAGAAELLALLAAEVRQPSPPGDGLHAFHLAQRYARLPNPPRVDLDLVRSLFAGPGHTSQGGRVLLQLVAADAAAAEIGRLIASGATGWKGSIPGEVVEGLLGASARIVADDHVHRLLASREDRGRNAAFRVALQRRLFDPDALLRMSREDPSLEIRGHAFEFLLRDLAPGALHFDAVRAEVMRVVRAPADPRHYAAIEGLSRIGADGLAIAAELIAHGGMPDAVAETLARTLVLGGRTDVLHGAARTPEVQRGIRSMLEGLTGESEAGLTEAASASVLRSMPLPRDPEEATAHFALAIRMHAPEIVTRVPAQAEVADEVRIAAVDVLVNVAMDDSPNHEIIAALRAVLVEVPVSAGSRRAVIAGHGSWLARGRGARRALLESVAKQDADPWVRAAAEEALRERED